MQPSTVLHLINDIGSGLGCGAGGRRLSTAEIEAVTVRVAGQRYAS